MSEPRIDGRAPTRGRRPAAVLAAAGALLVLLAGSCSSIDDPDRVVVEAGASETVPVDDPITDIVDADKAVAGGLDLPPTTLAYTLPVPEPLPLDPYEPTPEETVGTITIPSLGVDEPLHVGMTLTAINRGPSMWPGTALPGEVGNLVVAGHRTTYGGPFRDLDLLEEGDPVTFTGEDGAVTYEVVGTRIVEPEALDISDQTNYFTATLFACHPPGSAAQRIVVDLQLVDDDGEPVPAAQ